MTKNVEKFPTFVDVEKLEDQSPDGIDQYRVTVELDKEQLEDLQVAAGDCMNRRSGKFYAWFSLLGDKIKNALGK